MYVFDNAAPEAASRLEALAEVYDPGTVRHLEARGIDSGWHCLEVGGGRGSVASWLAERVGAAGMVLATDIDPRHLDTQGLENLEVRRHDILRDPLPADTFDLAHTRLVLSHLADPDSALETMVAALKPGGLARRRRLRGAGRGGGSRRRSRRARVEDRGRHARRGRCRE